MDYDVFMATLDDWLWLESYNNNVKKPIIAKKPSFNFQHDSYYDLFEFRLSLRDHMHPKTASLRARRKWEPTRLLSAITAAEASDPRDKVFSLYGIMCQLGMDSPKPDYEARLSDVYWKGCVSVIRSQDSLSCLELVNGPYWDTATPSWVPDLNRTVYRYPMEFHWLAGGAQLGSQPLIKFSDNDRLIHTRAWIADSVKGRIYWETHQGNLEDNIRLNIETIHAFQSWVIAATKITNYPKPHCSSFDALLAVMFQHSAWKNVFKKSIWEGKIPEPFKYEKMFVSLIRITVTDLDSFHTLYETAKTDEAYQRNFIDDPNVANLEYLLGVRVFIVICYLRLLDVYIEAWAKALGNALFWTQLNYLGTAPRCVKEDDIIAIIPGVRAPIVLRHFYANRYQVIGPAYIHGFMFPEEEEQERKDMVLTNIILE